MKTKLSFLKQIKFTGSLAIILLIVSLFLVYTHSINKSSNLYISSNIKQIEFEFLDDNYTEEKALAERNKIKFKDVSELTIGKFDFFEPKNILAKITIDPVEDEGTYLLINSNKRTKEYVNVYLEDKKLVTSYPQVVSYNPDGDFDYYLLPTSDEETVVYLYFEKEYGANGFSRPTFLVGTESELLLIEGNRSITDFMVGVVLILLGVIIYVMFYITGIDKYQIVKIFGLTFFLIALQCIIFSPFIMFAFNQFDLFFRMMKIITYFFLCSLSFSIPLLYVGDRRIQIFYVANIIFCFIAIFATCYTIYNGSYIDYEVANKYNIYFMFVIIYSIVLNLYNFEDENDIISIFRLISFSSMVILNMFFFYYETESSASIFKNPYYFILFTFVGAVICYISSILISRSKSIVDNRTFLYDEKETIDRLYKSNKNAIATTNIQEISENILADIEGIYPDLKFAMIIHRSMNKKLTVPASVGLKGDPERHAHRVFKKHYKRIPKSSFATYFSGDKAILSFRSSTGEALLIYIKNNKALTELDEIASEILASPVLLSFNNCRIYDEIYNTEKELLYAIGNLTYEKCGGIGRIWRFGEYCYLLARNTGFSEQVANNLRVASYVHDIGKVGMNDDYININKVSESDLDIFYQHTQIGHDMLSKFGGDTMKIGAICSLYHHEKYNGRGYLGKAAEEIPIEARIVIICNEFEDFYAKTENENKDFNQDQILEECFNFLSSNKQTVFDPLLVQLFIKDKEGILKILQANRTRELEEKKAN